VWGKKSSALVRSIWKRIPPFRGKSRLFRLFRRLTGHPRFTIAYGDGGWITVDDDGEPLERFVWFHGNHEVEVWQQISKFLDKHETFWDVGANIGTIAIPALLDERISEVHCFDPNPVVTERLRHNLRLNGSHFFVHTIALSSYSGTGTLYLASGNHSDMASLVLQRGTEMVQVQITTLDQLVANGFHPPTVIKIDVEGLEEQVLLGAQNLLRSSPPKIIVFETECDQFGNILNNRLTDVLSQFGYSIEWIRRDSGQCHFNEGRYWENYAAIRPD